MKSIFEESKRVLKDAAVYGLGDAFVRGLSVLTVPIFTRFFSPADYGTISVLVAIMGFVGFIQDFGMASAAQRQYYDHTTPAGKMRTTSTAFWFIFAWSIILAGIGALSGPLLADAFLKDTALAGLFWLALPASALAVIAQLLRSYFRLEFRPWPFAITSFFSGFATLGLAAWFVAQGQGIIGYFWGILLGNILGAVVTFLWSRSFIRLQISPGDLKSMLAFGIPLVPAAFAYFVFDLSDRFLLARLQDLSQVGLYAVAINLNSMLLFVISAFAQAWSPFAFAKHAEDQQKARELFAHFLTYVIVIFSFLALGLTLFSAEILRIFTTPEFYGAQVAIPILAFSAVAFATTLVTSLPISLARRTSVIAVAAFIAAGLNFGLNLVFIPAFGMLGAAWTTLIAYTSLTLVYYIAGQIIDPLPWNRYRALAGLVVAGLFLAFAHQLPDGFSFAAVSYKLGYLGLFIGSLFVVRVLTRTELQAARDILRYDIRFWRKHEEIPQNPPLP